MVEHLAYLGTEDGVLTLRRQPDTWEVVSTGLKGQQIHALAHHPERPAQVLAGSYGHGLFQSADAGRSWHPCCPGVTFAWIRSILVDPNATDTILVGTEPAAIFRSSDGGQSWTELAGVREVPGHERWYLPYSPRAGAVRSIASVSHAPGTYYAGIEQGGVIYTYDGGSTWELLDGTIDEDVHCLLADTNGGVTVFAATGGGVYRSFDGGKCWELVASGYTRAICQKPGHPAIVYAGPAQRVGHLGRIERSRDEGSTWEPWWCGLNHPLSGMVDQLIARPGSLDELGGLFAVLSTGEIFHSELDHPDWTRIVDGGLPKVNVLNLAVA
jgi:hypothetical protein